MQHEYTDILKVFGGLRCPELNNESIHFSVLLNKKGPILHPWLKYGFGFLVPPLQFRALSFEV